MFGYIVINQSEMKFKEYDVYRSYYCGLCQSLKERYGVLGQLSLNYDMTFILMLLTGLYEPRSRRPSADVWPSFGKTSHKKKSVYGLCGRYDGTFFLL